MGRFCYSAASELEWTFTFFRAVDVVGGGLITVATSREFQTQIHFQCPVDGQTHACSGFILSFQAANFGCFGDHIMLWTLEKVT